MTRGRDFEFIAGSPAFCLVDTVSGRGKAPIDLLGSPSHLARWLSTSGLHCAAGLKPTSKDLGTARRLREAIYRSGLAAIAEMPLATEDIGTLNDAAARPTARPAWSSDGLKWSAADPVDAALSVIAADALGILASEKRRRIRICEGCQMMFLDTSRPGLRRWCSSSSGCGNKAKMRSRRARQGTSNVRRSTV